MRGVLFFRAGLRRNCGTLDGQINRYCALRLADAPSRRGGRLPASILPHAFHSSVNNIRTYLRDSVDRIDFVVWGLVIVFFQVSAAVNGGDGPMSLLAALGIIAAMLLISTSIEVLIGTLRNMPGIGTLIGFITNGPEALVLLIGLLDNDIIFASSTPLGSNPMNVLLFFLATTLTGTVAVVWARKVVYRYLVFIATIAIALSFYLIPVAMYSSWLIYWLIGVLAISGLIFATRPAEELPEEDVALSRIWMLPALAVLVGAGVLLDFVVSMASDVSMAPKGVIGFIVLSTMTSWPEFKSTLSLLRKDMPLAAFLNILVSNITNLWLACLGVLIFWLLSL